MTRKNRPKPPEVAERARELRAQGKSREDVAKELGVSTGWVSKVWAETPQWAPATLASDLPVASGTEDDEPVVETAKGDEGREEIRTLLRRQTVGLERMQKLAEKNGNLTAFTSIARAISSNEAMVAKFEPPARPNPEDSPDMRAAAKRAREKLHDLLERAMGLEGEGT